MHTIKPLRSVAAILILTMSAIGGTFCGYAAAPSEEVRTAKAPPISDNNVSSGSKRSPPVTRVLLPKTAVSEKKASKAPDPKRWLRQPVSFDVADYSLAKILREFASLQGVSCIVSENLGGSVSGLSAFKDPGLFLDLLCRAQNMNWYYDGTTVYFFPDSEMSSRLFLMKGVNEERLRQGMIELGLYDPRFSWRMTDDGTTLMVQGPEPYLKHIEKLREHQSQTAGEKEITRRLGVFRLEHAWAGDRAFASGGNQIQIPGVAAMLQQIVAEGVSQQRREERESGETFIQADPRLNAVLVWDYERNMELYRSIIKQLDQPLALVEIQAAVIDVDAARTRELGLSPEIFHNGGSWQPGFDSNVRPEPEYSGTQFSSVYTSGMDQFMARVAAIAKDGQAKILSRPTVLTQDNIEAVMQNTETFYVKLQGNREEDLADIKTGLTLRVTPRVTQDVNGVNAIQLAVHIADGSSNAAKKAGVLPRVRESSISTQAVVYEGEALVVGRYYNDPVSRCAEVPERGKVPVFSALFRGRKKVTTRSERLFVLAPRVVFAGDSITVPGR